MGTLSVIVITKNEGRCIARCLESVQWADEIIVLDSGSTDNTAEICRQWTPHVYETDWPGYGEQKNRGIDKATGDWILFVDADEEVSEGLRREIQECMTRDEYTGYKIPRLNRYCGEYLRHGGWWPDYHPRLTRRGKATFNDKAVHENLIVDGRVKNLTQPLLHDSAPNLESVLSKMDRYSSLAAQMRFSTGESSSLPKAISRGIWAFFSRLRSQGWIP